MRRRDCARGRPRLGRRCARLDVRVLAVLDRPDGRAELERAIALVAGAGRRPIRCAGRPACAAGAGRRAGHRGAGPGRAAGGGRGQVRRAGRRGCCSPPDGLQQATRAELADHRAARFAAAGLGHGAGPVLRHRRRPAGLPAGRPGRRPGSSAIRSPPPWPRLNTGCPIAARRGRAGGLACSRGGVLRSGPAHRSRAGPSTRPASRRRSASSLDVLGTARFAAAKLAPGLDHALMPAGVEAEWVSFGRRGEGGGAVVGRLHRAGRAPAGQRVPGRRAADRCRSGQPTRSARSASTCTSRTAR